MMDVGRLRVLMLVVLMVVAILGTLPWNGNPLPFRASELRVLMCARTMAEGGDWMVPIYDREVRINKPPLMYWVVATVFRAVGGTESLAVARGVNGVFGVLLVVTIYGCGRYWVGRRRAWVGGVVAATCYLFLRFTRVCETDVALTLFTTLACYGLWRAAAGRGGWRWWILAGMFSGIGFMFKGPAALILPLCALVTAHVTKVTGSWRRTGGGLLLASLPFLAIVMPWYVCLLVGRVQGAAEKDIGFEMAALLKESPHHGPIIYYLYLLPAYLMPWGIFLPSAMFQAWRRRCHKGVRFLLGWLISAVVVMSFVKSKQPHYAMLLLPPAALLTGSFLHEAMRTKRMDRFKVTRGLLSMLRWMVVAVGVGVVVVPYIAEGAGRGAGWFWGVSLMLVGVLVPLVKWGRQVDRHVAMLAVAALLGTAGYNAVLHECREPAAMYRECALEARRRMGVSTQVFIAGRRTMSMEYYMHHVLTRFTDVAKAWERATRGDLVIVAVDTKHGDVSPQEPFAVPVFERKQNGVALKLYER